ncbi:MAG: Clp protease ClpP [Bacteroidales bacterium]
MEKKLKIEITANGTQGRIDIIGHISEWGKNNAVDMRQRCQELKESGVAKCHVYIMTVGGDCFQANEIVNILHDVFGSFTGEGGALVASAGTYIAVCAKNFVMAENGQFMIHKPSGWVDGNEKEIENYLTLLRNMTSTYYNAYKSKLIKPEGKFKEKWESGDFWMTAQEAKEWGFITDIKEPVQIDQETAKAIKESGSPIALAKIDINQTNKEEKMDLKPIIIALGMQEANEEQIVAKIKENATKAANYDILKAEMERKEKERKEADIKAVLDKAENEKRIKADSREQWLKMLNSDFESTKELIESLHPVQKLSSELKLSADNSGATYQGKTFEQLQDENPEALAELEKDNPEAYDALFADWKKRNKIK